jgi:hypothetical protein
MHTPSQNDVPSEQTIEVMSNHFLLAGLNAPSAWVFCPTRVQEQSLGYDASLQNGKILVIQYKRVHVNQGGSLRVPITQAQHDTLRQNFPSGNVPYVFYGFSIYPTYQQLDAGFHGAGAPLFFANARFVNLHDLPAVCNSLRYSPQQGVKPVVNGQAQAAVASIDGNQLVHGILECTSGLTLAEFFALVGTAVTWRTLTPHTSVLIFAT